MSSHLRFFSYAAIFVVLALTSRANAKFGSEACKEVPEPSSIQEMIEQSDFVALYRVKERLISEEDKAWNKMQPLDRVINPLNPIVQYRLSDVYSLLGHGPRDLVVEGTRNIIEVPDAFFFMQKRHEKLVQRNSLSHGSSSRGTDANGNCRYWQRFVPGYYYLIFGGITSSAAAEPILDISYDAFYLEVERIIRRMSK